jgi:hypothetical protein
MDLKRNRMGWHDWNNLVQDRDQQKAIVNSNEPFGSVKCWEILE